MPARRHLGVKGSHAGVLRRTSYLQLTLPNSALRSLSGVVDGEQLIEAVQIGYERGKGNLEGFTTRAGSLIDCA